MKKRRASSKWGHKHAPYVARALLRSNAKRMRPGSVMAATFWYLGLGFRGGLMIYFCNERQCIGCNARCSSCGQFLRVCNITAALFATSLYQVHSANKLSNRHTRWPLCSHCAHFRATVCVMQSSPDFAHDKSAEKMPCLTCCLHSRGASF